MTPRFTTHRGPARGLACWFALVLWMRFGGPALAAGERGAVATVQPLATEAGLAALADGGNAVDAAVACALMLGVVDGHDSGLGGGCFILIRLTNGRVVAVDGREEAPQAATRDLFLREGKADPRLSQDGPLAIGVPGELAALSYVASMYGRLPLHRALERAAQVAEQGFVPDPNYRARVDATFQELKWAPDDAPAFLEFRRVWRGAMEGRALEGRALEGRVTRVRSDEPRGDEPRGDQLRGDLPDTAAPSGLVRLPELGHTYRQLANHGPGYFYRGSFAKQASDHIRSLGGLVTPEDFASYKVRQREPLRTTYRGYEIIGFPPPSSGGVHVGEILNVLEHFDLRAMGEDSADFVQVITEAMKLAFADRAHWLGDPEFAKVPRGLMSKAYAAELASRIDLQRATPVTTHGEPPDASSDYFERERNRHTTHFSTMDAQGNWVACTATINTSFGSKVVVPGTGLVMNNEMDDFAAQPGVPNFFGLVGADANAVEARKRPLSSMSPTLVLRDGVPVLSVGAAGGPTIISQTLLAIIRTVDFGHDPATALRGLRFHHQWRPDVLQMERAWPDATVAELRRRGHTVELVNRLGATQAVGRTPDDRFSAAADPRGSGSGEVR